MVLLVLPGLTHVAQLRLDDSGWPDTHFWQVKAGESYWPECLGSLPCDPLGVSLLFVPIVSGFQVPQESINQYTSTFQASACIMFAHVPLAKESHMVKPRPEWGIDSS